MNQSERIHPQADKLELLPQCARGTEMGTLLRMFWQPVARSAALAVGHARSVRILANANDICLILNSSVNSYRRLDPHFEAPNQIKVSPSDRGSMIRIPIGNEKSARTEVRSIAPDANPYLAIYTLFRTGLEGPPDRSRGRCPTLRNAHTAGNERDRVRGVQDDVERVLRTLTTIERTVECDDSDARYVMPILKMTDLDLAGKRVLMLEKGQKITREEITARLGDILLASGRITQDQLAAAIEVEELIVRKGRAVFEGPPSCSGGLSGSGWEDLPQRMIPCTVTSVSQLPHRCRTMP